MLLFSKSTFIMLVNVIKFITLTFMARLDFVTAAVRDLVMTIFTFLIAKFILQYIFKIWHPLNSIQIYKL